MATQTFSNIGIRRNFAVFGWRNYENAGTTLYNSNQVNLWWVDTNLYQPGQNLPFDVGGVSYSKKAILLLNFYWEQGWISPTA